jgi:G3E family GTPase
VKILCIAGFLGSGKTTLLLELARLMTADSLRLAIVENEIGEIGIDGDAVGEQGLPVRELFGGCICCTLQAGLVETLRSLGETTETDWVIVEPTGLAAPGDITAAIGVYLPEVTRVHILTLVDAERWEMLRQTVEPLITAQIERADVIAVTKVDTIDEAALRGISTAARAINPQAPILPVCATTGAGVLPVYQTLPR